MSDSGGCGDGFELVRLQAGGWSLRKISNRETFHPVVGPVNEARILHVEQQRLLERSVNLGRRMVVWDVGLGAAANALAVVGAFESCADSSGVDLHSFDSDCGPLEFALRHSTELGYPVGYSGLLRRLLEGAARYPEARPVEYGRVRWCFHLGDFAGLVRTEVLPAPDAILYDPYSPASNPEMWCLEHFRFLYGQLSMDRPCLWSNYTRSTSVRTGLLLAGFHVGLGCGVGAKDQTTVATNQPELLEKPLDSSWLRRVRGSTRGGALRVVPGLGAQSGPISAEEWDQLLRHPQFAGEGER